MAQTLVNFRCLMFFSYLLIEWQGWGLKRSLKVNLKMFSSHVNQTTFKLVAILTSTHTMHAQMLNICNIMHHIDRFMYKLTQKMNQFCGHVMGIMVTNGMKLKWLWTIKQRHIRWDKNSETACEKCLNLCKAVHKKTYPNRWQLTFFAAFRVRCFLLICFKL